jgi:hypothetical protein
MPRFEKQNYRRCHENPGRDRKQAVVQKSHGKKEDGQNAHPGLSCRLLYAPQLAQTTAPGLTVDRQNPQSSPMGSSMLAGVELCGITF